MNYELHPLCTLFPRISGDEFGALVAFNGKRDDCLGIADFERAMDGSDFWNFSIFDIHSKEHVTSKRPIAGEGVALLLDQFGGRDHWLLKAAPRAKTRQPIKDKDDEAVYFIRAGDFIKIGKTTGSPAFRMFQLQTGCPFPMEIAAVIHGGLGTEAELHRRFMNLRARGEWFHARPQLIEFIESIKKGGV